MNEDRQIQSQVNLDGTQGICDLIGRSVRFWRLNLRSVVKLLLWPSLVMMGCLIVFQCFFSQISRFNFADPLSITIAVAAFFSFFLLIWSACVTVVRQMALVRWFCGFAEDLVSAVKAMKGKMLPAVGLVLLFSLLAGGGGLLGAGGMAASAYLYSLGKAGTVAGAITMIMCVMILVFYFSLALILLWMSLSVLACEDIALSKVIARAFNLCAGNFWRCLAFGSMAFVFVNILDTGFAVPLVALQAIDYAVRTSMGNYSSQSPLWVMVVMQMWSATKDMFLRPIVQFAFGMLYLDLCCRRDGLDLRRRLTEIKAPFQINSVAEG